MSKKILTGIIAILITIIGVMLFIQKNNKSAQILELDPKKVQTEELELVVGDNVYVPNKHNNKYVKVPKAQPETFKHVGVCNEMSVPSHYSSYSYYRDAKNIYINSKVAENIAADSFEYLGTYTVRSAKYPTKHAFAKDADSVYQSCVDKLSGADPDSFEMLKVGYAKDADSVWYYRELKLPKANPKTFTVISDDKNYDREVYGKDSQYVWQGSNLQKGVDPTTCTEETIEQCAE